MAAVVRMPSVAAGATEATIANWLVQPGDTVAAGTPIAEIETEKALVEYAAEQAGVIGRLVVAAGDTAEIGDPIAVLIAASETDADIDAALGRAPAVAPATSPRTCEAPAAIAEDGAGNGHPGAARARTRVFASPLVRKLAGQQGIDLATIAGTGPNGRIVRRDFEQFTTGRASATPHAPASARVPGSAHAPASVTSASIDGTRLVPHTPMRRAIARRLTEAKATVPHFYLTAECVVDDLLALRRQVNDASPVKVSINDFVLVAAAAAFRAVPEANVTWSDEGLLAPENVDLSIAVATDGGLVTPVLRSVDRLRLCEVARSAADLAQRARDRRLRQQEIEGGTFTISNLGMYGTLEFAAIINPPQSGILAVGAASQQPVVVDGAVTAATVMRCTLSVDHRAIDGALAARWLAAFTARLENPLTAIV
jgi:pyruvate dehydrogenase E2 component (dihydrolipoamide acetyltransferase)